MRFCSYPGCNAIVQRGRCRVHTREAWTSDQGEAPRIRGRKLQQLRKDLFRKHPLCVLCLAVGRVTPATIRDHVIPLSENGPDTEENTQALCVHCSDEKTAREAQRGKVRARL